MLFLFTQAMTEADSVIPAKLEGQARETRIENLI
jgi:hypothetical protein